MNKKVMLTGIVIASLLFWQMALASSKIIPFTENEAKFAKSLVDNDVNKLFSGGKVSGNYECKYITVRDLYKKYYENEVRANRELKYKKVIISGKVKSINNYPSDGKSFIALSAGSFLDTVHAALGNNFQDYALELHKGQKITLACEVVGTVVGEPVVEDCIPERSAKEQVTQSLVFQINKAINGDRDESNKKVVAIVALTKLVSLSTNNFSICKKIDIYCLQQANNPKWKKFAAENKDQIEQYRKMLDNQK
ncbi:hypothetical protein HGO23_08745 [Xenorhabdus budapestensis]|uniref:tRNA_anti-like n=1 Tax=Xenorhabdus budapestensis TaxID=290110 RepID=A0ABX7VN46_XENBU|nr:hypothetical protein [Xenorhabdus budapestensis]QTL41371.1 hypothetical protein HGO23_08745 [Xenorhabdus budapestensis]